MTGTVPKLWPESMIVCMASGPSLTLSDVDFVRGKARVIVVNDTYRLVPWADVLYACDDSWWNRTRAARTFAGLKYGLLGSPVGVTVLKNTGKDGLELSPDGLRTGKNSGYQAVNLAVHLGASRIVLLGYDMQHTSLHWFGQHPMPEVDHGKDWRAYFQTLVEPLRRLGIQVVNCTRETALTCFPRARLSDVMQDQLEQAS